MQLKEYIMIYSTHDSLWIWLECDLLIYLVKLA